MKLQQLIEEFLAFRRSLGESQVSNAVTLRAFSHAIGTDADIADVQGEQVDAFLAGTGSITSNWHTKHSTLRVFYRYAISRGYVAAVPLPAVIPKRLPPFVPYIFSHQDLCRLFAAAESDPRHRTCLEPVTTRTILLLLYGAGLRLREVVNLNCGNVDLDGSLLTVHQTKFGKTRLIPFGPELGSALARHAARARMPRAEAPFFTTRAGLRVKPNTLQHHFRFLCRHAGVCRTDGASEQPRLHDLRHTFAVHRLTSWYRQGADVQRLLPQLSVYLGHVHLRATQVYLTMTPELLQEASRRFEHYAWEGAHP